MRKFQCQEDFSITYQRKSCMGKTSLHRDSIWRTSINSKWVSVTSKAFYLVSLNETGIESYRNK